MFLYKSTIALLETLSCQAMACLERVPSDRIKYPFSSGKYKESAQRCQTKRVEDESNRRLSVDWGLIFNATVRYE